MQKLLINLTTRKPGKQGKRELSEHDILGVVYGHGVNSIPVKADHREVLRVFEVAGTNQLIDVVIDGKEKHQVLFKDIDRDPITGKIRHFDLYVIKKGEKITANIPIVLIGESPAVKLGNVVQQLLENIEVSTIPSKLPEKIEIDISNLKEPGDAIYVRDLTLEEGVEILTELEQPIVRVDEPRQIEEEPTEEPEEEIQPGEVPSEHGATQPEDESSEGGETKE